MATQKIQDAVNVVLDSLFSEAELALRWNVHPITLQRRNVKGRGPKPTLIQKKRFYEKTAVYAWEREERKRPTAKGSRP